MPKTMKRDLASSLTRWNAFWKRDVSDRPPLVIRFAAEEGPPSSSDAPVDPNAGFSAETEFSARISPEGVALAAQNAERAFTARAGFPDDMLPIVAAPSGIGLTGWLLGCEVTMSAGIPWALPRLSHISQWRSRLDEERIRLRVSKMREIDRLLVRMSNGRYAVGVGNADGPADMVVRLLGEEPLAMALYDKPGEVQDLFTFLGRIWETIVLGKRQDIPLFCGGTATGWDYWVPGRAVSFQEDFAQMISPDHFRSHVLPHDRRLVEHVDSAWFHVHSGALHMAREIALSGGFAGVQICNDYPAGPTPEEMLPVMKLIQRHGCLILRKFTIDQLDRVVPHLSPQGLAVDVQCFDSTVTADIQNTPMSRNDAESVLRWAREVWM